MLEALYTDLCANAGVGAALDRLCPNPLRKNGIARLLHRRVPSEALDKLYTFDGPAIRYLFRQMVAGANIVRKHQALNVASKEFAEAMIAKGTGEATHVFSMFGEG